MSISSNASRGDADPNQSLQSPPPEPTPCKPQARRYSPEIWAQVRPRFEAGETPIALSKAFGMAANSIRYRAYGEDWTLPEGFRRRRYKKRVHLAHETWLQIGPRFLAGMTASQIAKEYGPSPATVYRKMKELGFSKKHNPHPPLVLPEPPAPPPPAPPWKTIAHPAQLAPSGDWRTWLFQGGRGAGKTRAGAEWLLQRMRNTPNGIFALVGATLHDVREVMIDGPAGVMNLPGAPEMKYEISRRRLSIKDGAVAYAFSAEEPRRLRGPQFDGAWADEFCAWDRPQDALDMLRLCLRRGEDPRLVVTTTPRAIPALRRLRGESSCVLTQAPSVANAANLSPRFLEGLIELYRDTDLEKQELNGDLLDGAKHGVWTPEAWKKVRGNAPSSFERVVVAVDPPASTGGSACGIVVAGKRGPRAYVLADRTAQDLSPLGWAMRAVDAAREFGAHAIVAESNQGGEMVRATLAQADPSCAIELVRARYGKRERATPITMLYQRELITHCGAFAALEEELMALDGDLAARLDRADALVWALTVLMFDPREGYAPGLRML